MPVLRAFAAHRPPGVHAARVATLPSGALSRDEWRAIAAPNPASFLHVSRPVIDLPADHPQDADETHRTGAENFASFIEQGLLVEDPSRHFYLYAQNRGAHEQAGIVACVSVEDLACQPTQRTTRNEDEGVRERISHIEKLRAHDEPVFLTYRGDSEIDWLARRAMQAPPDMDFTTDDAVRHRVWVLDAKTSHALSLRFAAQNQRWEAVSRFYLAAGQHLCAAAAAVHRKRQPGRHGESDVFPAVLVPHDQVRIVPFHRVVRDPRRRAAGVLLGALGAFFDIERADDRAAATPDAVGTFGLYVGGRWFRARVRHGIVDAKDPLESLDVSICDRWIVRTVVGMSEPDDGDLRVIDGDLGIAEVERLVDADELSMGVHLFPIPIEQFFAVCDGGFLVPANSMRFDLSPRSGLFVHQFL